MKPILCVRNQETVPLGIVADALDEGRFEWRYLDAWRDSAVPDLSDIGALIVLGGEMNVDELDAHPFLKTVRDLTRDAVRAEIPTLGICLGAQMMSRALDAPVTRAPQRELGFVPVRATDAGRRDPVLAPFAPEAHVFQFHEDTCALPPGAELLFTGDTVAVQAFRVGERAYGVQFHFEVTMREVETWCDATPNLEANWGLPKEEVVAQARRLLGTQQERGREVTRRFVALVAEDERGRATP